MSASMQPWKTSKNRNSGLNKPQHRGASLQVHEGRRIRFSGWRRVCRAGSGCLTIQVLDIDYRNIDCRGKKAPDLAYSAGLLACYASFSGFCLRIVPACCRGARASHRVQPILKGADPRGVSPRRLAVNTGFS